MAGDDQTMRGAGVSATKRRRHRAKLERRAEQARTNGYDPDAEYAIQAAWCAGATDLAEARQRTHDQLIEQMGDQRDGAVRWQWWHGSEALRVVRLLRSGPASAELAGYYGQIEAHLRRSGGFLVVATAAGRRP